MVYLKRGIEEMNKKIIMKMAFDKDVIAALLRIHRIFKKDKNYTVSKGIRAAKEIMKGEKIVKFQDKYILSTFSYYKNLFLAEKLFLKYILSIFG